MQKSLSKSLNLLAKTVQSREIVSLRRDACLRNVGVGGVDGHDDGEVAYNRTRLTMGNRIQIFLPDPDILYLILYSKSSKCNTCLTSHIFLS